MRGFVCSAKGMYMNLFDGAISITGMTFLAFMGSESSSSDTCWCECFLHVDVDGSIVPPMTSGAKMDVDDWTAQA